MVTELNNTHLHSWTVTAKEAVGIQKRFGPSVVRVDDLPGKIQRIAGVDVGFRDNGQLTRAAVAVLSYPGLVLIDQAVAVRPTSFPYIPGLLSFREIPAIMDALNELESQPDLICCDGHGYAHPRRFGLACHLGVLSGIASIGVGKTRLVGTHGRIPERKGEWVPLMDAGEVIGAVLRSRAGVKPVFVSTGHRVSLKTAVEYVMSGITRYKLPETIRHAHRLASLSD